MSELSTQEIIDLVNSDEPIEIVDDPPVDAETPAPETPSVPTPEVQGEAAVEGQEGAPPEPPKTPEWLATLSPEDKRAWLESQLRELPQDDLANIAPVREALNRAQQSAQAQGRNQAEEQISQTQRQAQLDQIASTYVERLEAGLVENHKAEAQNYERFLRDDHEKLIGRVLGADLRKLATDLGIDRMPAEVDERATDARRRDGIAGAYREYTSYLLEQAKAQSHTAGREEGQGAARARDAAHDAVVRADYKRELIEQGLLKDPVAPLIDGTPASAPGTGEIDDREWAAALSDDAKMDALMSDPAKVAFLQRQLAGAT